MLDKYIKLRKTVLFKKRYGKWYFIDSQKYYYERFEVNKKAVKIIKYLLNGHLVCEVLSSFKLIRRNIIDSLKILQQSGYINFSNKPKKHGLSELEPPLDILNVLITNRCNLKCPHCYLKSGKAMPEELTFNQWQNVFQQAKDLGVYGINILGGELLMYNGFFKICKLLAKIDTFNINLNTNGTLISKKNLGFIKEAFDSVQISLDYYLPEKFDAFRGKKGLFKSVLSAIELLTN